MTTANAPNLSGFARYINGTGSSTQTNFAAGAVQRLRQEVASDPITAGDVEGKLFPIGENLIATLCFFASSTDGDPNNEAFTARVFGVIPLLTATTQAASGFFLQVYLGGISATVGNMTGAAGAPVVVTEKFVDTITWTPSDVGTTPGGPLVPAEGAFNEGTSNEYQATVPDDLFTLVFLPCIIRCTALAIYFNSAAATTRPNCLIGTKPV